MDNKKIGDYISTLRRNNNLTQKDLADKLGITDKAISKWERGAGYPDISMLRPLADALGTTVNELLEGQTSENVSQTNSADLDNALNYADKMITIKENKLGKITAAILAISLLISIFTCVIVDIAVTKSLSWSILVIAGCIMSGALFLPPLIWKIPGILISLCLLSLMIMPFLSVIQSETIEYASNGEWLWELGFPISLIWLVYLWFMILLYKKAKTSIWFYICIGIIFCIPCSITTNYIVDKYVALANDDVINQITNISTGFCLFAIAGICFVVGLLKRSHKQQAI